MQTLPCCINHKHYTKSEKCNLFTTYAHGNGNDRWMILLHYIKLLYMQSWWFIRGGNRLYMCIFFKSTLFLSQSKFTNTFKPKILLFSFCFVFNRARDSWSLFYVIHIVKWETYLNMSVFVIGSNKSEKVRGI